MVLFLSFFVALGAGVNGVSERSSHASHQRSCAADSQEFMVGFHEYSFVSEHKFILERILGPNSGSGSDSDSGSGSDSGSDSGIGGFSWQHVPRDNPATRTFPSDFALIRLLPPAAPSFGSTLAAQVFADMQRARGRQAILSRLKNEE